MAGISSLGIGSGILTSDLVDKLVAAERKPTEARLNFDQQKTEALISAFGKLKSAVTELRLPARRLASADDMQAFKASNSNSDVLGVTLDTKQAKAGTFNIEVTALAKAASLASGSFADKDITTVGSGTLTITSGEKTGNIVIDGSNNTLEGVAKAINEAALGVSASVIDTGSGFRLSVTGEKTGVDNAITIDVADADGNNTDIAGLSQLAFNATVQNLTQTVAAQDSALTVNGIAISRSDNKVDGVIDGVSLTLTSLGSTEVKVSRDTGAIGERVQGFVDKYNALQGVIKDLTRFTPGEGGSLLTGDSVVRGINRELRSLMGQIVPGLEGASVRSLADVGITTNFETGLMDFDRSVLDKKLASAPEDVVALFAEQGRSSNANVEFLSSTSATKPGDYAVNITQAATRGAYTGSVAIADPVTIDANNDTFSIKVDDGTSTEITLAQGTYSRADLVAQIQSQLDSNASLSAADQGVKVSLDGGNQLVLSSERFGSVSNVAITAVDTNTAASLGLSVATGTAGKDVAGTIDGIQAFGEGQTLLAEKGNAEGLKIRVTGSTTGAMGEVSFIEGIGERMVNLVTNTVGPDGAIGNRVESYESTLERIEQDRIKLAERTESYRERLVAQFSAADALIGQLNSLQDYLANNLAALNPGRQKAE